MKYHIERNCRIRFTNPAREHHIQIRLTPCDDETQSLVGVALSVEPKVEPVATYDSFGNLSHHFALLSAHKELSFSLVADVETRRENPYDFSLVPPERELDWISDRLARTPRLWDFVLHRGLLTPELPDEISGLPTPSFHAGASLIEQVQTAFGWVRHLIRYDPSFSVPAADLAALFTSREGSSADLAHLLIALVRRWRVPARFVSGYLDAAYFEAPGHEEDPVLPQHLHHWVEVLIPGGGWRGFDPALGLAADATYVRVAVGRDADDIEPLRQACLSDGTGPELEETLLVSRLS